MATQASVTVRNAMLDALESAIGTGAFFDVRSGAPPANTAAADSGMLLASMGLASDWMAAAASGSKAKLGTWQDASANNDGTAGHWRIYASDHTTCHLQGTIAVTGTGGDNVELDTTTIVTGRQVTITAFAIAAANS
jgi:uncharacterized cupin superfamily protein